MISETILPGLTIIPTPTPFDIGTVNAILAEGDTLTLIDGGVGTDEAYRALADGVAAKGHRLSDIRRLLISHHHTDHIGLAPRVVAESGATVIAHPYSVPWLQDPQGTRLRFSRLMRPVLCEAGIPSDLLDGLDRVDEFLASMTGTVPVAGTLDEGDTIALAGYEWQVYHTPGHAGGMLCLYQPDTRVALTSDHLLREVSSNPLLEPPAVEGGERPRRLLDYIDHMQRIAALDIAVAYTGHGQPITDVRALVTARLEHHRKRADRVYGLLNEQPRTVYEVSRLLFPKAPETLTFLTISEALGHIDLLERENRVSSELRDGVAYWSGV